MYSKNGIKKCSMCGKEKEDKFFNNASHRKDGLSHYCKECTKIKRATSKTNNIKSYFSDVIRTSRQSALKRKIKDYSITRDYLVELFNKQNGLCEISNIPMTHLGGSGKVLTNSSIDRIDSNLGYIDGNIQLVCLSINLMKMNSSQEEFMEFVNLFVKNTRI